MVGSRSHRQMDGYTRPPMHDFTEQNQTAATATTRTAITMEPVRGEREGKREREEGKQKNK